MGRARLPAAFVTKEKVRNKTFQKRKKVLLQKAYELSVLCNADVCVIIYGCKDDSLPEIWPPSPPRVLRIIGRYVSVSEEYQNQRAQNVFDVLEGRKKKAERDLNRLKRRACENKYPTWHDSLDTFDQDQLRLLLDNLVQKLDVVRQRIAVLRSNQNLIPSKKDDIIRTSISSITSNNNNNNNNNHNSHSANGYGPYGNMHGSSLEELPGFEYSPFGAYGSSSDANLGLETVPYDPNLMQNPTLSLTMNDADLSGAAVSSNYTTMPYGYSTGTCSDNQVMSLIQDPTISLLMNDAGLVGGVVSSSYTTMPCQYSTGTCYYNPMMSLIQEPTMSLLMNDADLVGAAVPSSYTTVPYEYSTVTAYYDQTMSLIENPTMSLMMNDADLGAAAFSSSYTTMSYGYSVGISHYDQAPGMVDAWLAMDQGHPSI